MSSIINIKSESDRASLSRKKRKRMHSECSDDDARLNSYKSHCGLLGFRPRFLRKLATIQMFVLASCILVTFQQALSSGYFNSVLTTIEKRFDIPSRMTGLMVSTFEIGNLITIVFVSYFGTNRHIPVWIGKGVLLVGVGSLIFALPHFMHDFKPPLKDSLNTTLDDSLCHPELVNPLMEQASHLLNVISPDIDPRSCNLKGNYRAPQLIVFMIAMILIGCGSTPILTLGTIYIDDHTLNDDSSMYIGFVYSMVAFGLMVGYLLGSYFITLHENTLGTGPIPAGIYNGHPKFRGNWWLGFLMLGCLLILISFVFFMFPKSLRKDKKRKRMAELQNSMDQCITITTEQCPKNQLNQLNKQLSQLSNQAGLCESCSGKPATNLKCANEECTNNIKKSIKCLPPNPGQLVSFLHSSANANPTTNSAVPFANPNLATSTTTTKLQLSIAPPSKRHHRHHSASAMINCTSSLLLGDQGYTATQPIMCNATTNIKLGHHRSISTSTIHHHLHLHHLVNSLNSNAAANNANNQAINQQQQTQQQIQQQQSQDKQPLVAKENELKLDLYKRDDKTQENNADFESSMDSCSLISSSCASERKLKDIPSCMWSLLSNPVYILTCLGSCMELCIVSGFLVFLPKYLETQFSISKSQANLYSGGIAVPGACVGIFLGGYLLKKLQLKPKDAIQFVLFFQFVCMGLYTALYFLGCNNVKMAGTTYPYLNNSSHLEAFQVNLNSQCNHACRCNPNEIDPICGVNDVTYFSACWAGCQTSSGPRDNQVYSNCSCIQHQHFTNEKIPLSEAKAYSGVCKQSCKTMVPFLILLFVVTLVVSIAQMPLLMIILRSVREDERAFALGMQFVLFRLFGYIPSPILFGEVIDSSCLLWKTTNCGTQGGFCLIYNIEHFRLSFMGVCSALKVAAGLLFFLDFFLICYRNRLDQQQPVRLTIDEVVNSIYNLDQQITKALHCDKKTDDDLNSNTELHTLNGNHDSDYNSADYNSVNDEE